MYYLVQFADDGILDIKTDDDFRTREDGLKEAQYGDTFYLCTIIFESDDKEEVMKRKVAMHKLKNPKQTEQSKMKKIGKKTKGNRKNVGEERRVKNPHKKKWWIGKKLQERKQNDRRNE